MEDITTRNDIITDLEQYIKKGPFLDPKTKEQKFWLHNLPENEELFNIIELLRNKYNYETFIITQNINITNQNINKEINLSNCIFENKFTVEKSLFSCINFDNSTFKENVSFNEIIFDKNILHLLFSFNSVKFEGYKTEFVNSELHNISFAESIFNSEITSFQFSKIYDGTFYKTEFRENVLFDSFGNNPKTEIQNTSFKKAIFNKQANFQQVLFFNNILFENTLFKGDTFFLEAKFYQINNNINNEYKNKLQENNDIKEKSEVNFKKCNFVGNIYFSEAVFETDVDFSGSQFNTISFGNAIFDRNVRFHKTTFNNNIVFFNTSFNKLVEFYRAHFYKPIQFHFTDFLDRAIFSSTEFDEEVQFLHCRVESNSYIRFESVTFKKSLDISRSNFNDKANFWNIELEEGDAFTSSKYQNDFDEKAKTESTKNTPTIYKKIRETYRIIKSNFYSQNNKIEGLKFYEKEMSVYLEEKRAEDKKLNRTNKFTLRNLNLENKVDSFFTNKSAIIKKKLTSFCSFFICFYQNILLPSYELLPFIEIFKSILSQFKKTFKEVFSFLYKPFYIILYIIVISFKEFRNRNITLYRSSFCIMILFFFLAYMIKKEYCWFWAFVIISTLVVLTEFYDRRKDTRKLIRSNNYIPFVLITFALIWSFIVFYGYGNYKQDFFYLLINKTYYSIKIIIKDIDMLVIGSYGIIILSFIFLVVFRRQDKIILRLNKNSNEFETNWVVGVNFSMLVGCLTYFTILLSINSNIVFDESTEGISNFLTSLVDVFNITKWDNLEIIGVKLKGFSYLLLFIGRIFIGYGYYQTIQAFRKFGKS